MSFKKIIKIVFAFIASFLLVCLVLVFYVIHDESPMKESFAENTSFVEIETDCFDYCFTEKDRYFLKNELKVFDKDTVRLKAEFHGIKSVIGVVKYEKSLYIYLAASSLSCDIGDLAIAFGLLSSCGA